MEASCGGRKLFIKMAINLDKEQPYRDPEDTIEPSIVRVPVAFEKESRFYDAHLRKLQGTLVPRHYGLWTCRSSWGGIMLFSIFDLAGMPAYTLKQGPRWETTEQRLMCLRALSKLHDHNIEHGSMITFEDLCHCLVDPETQSAHLVDFAWAEVDHQCEGNFPPEYATRDNPACCEEVEVLANALGAFSIINGELARGHEQQEGNSTNSNERDPALLGNQTPVR
ncbi:hypothetical protein HGRIS_006468 [Hohenbuehelia grisea]|uniref:Protein kinase domain-containing protein n=1 Tax=Hohenbuehelia grisea TaxID=104357 RepID=A0ABR3K1B8_9AGAR